MLVACFVLIGNSYFNVNIITQITKSIGSVSLETVKKYIENQKNDIRPRKEIKGIN